MTDAKSEIERDLTVSLFPVCHDEGPPSCSFVQEC